MKKETIFFIYLLEKYAEHKNKFSYDVLKEWDRLNLTDELYHCERLENAFNDIDLLIRERLTANKNE